jgi:hypothetical protein
MTLRTALLSECLLFSCYTQSYMQFLSHSKTNTLHVPNCNPYLKSAHDKVIELMRMVLSAPRCMWDPPWPYKAVTCECNWIFITGVVKYAHKISYVPVIKNMIHPSYSTRAHSRELASTEFLLPNCSILRSQLPVVTPEVWRHLLVHLTPI